MDCIFCKIISGQIPSGKFYEDSNVIAFDDISPQAPVHYLIVPKEHISSVGTIDVQNHSMLSSLFSAIKKTSELKGVDKNGFRIIINNGENGGQEVPHLHVHILGGKKLGAMVSSR